VRLRSFVAVSAFVVGTGVIVASAGAVPLQGKVAAHQTFGGLVNGKNGVSSPAPIRMACFGAVRPGQKGHPMGGQTVEVFRPEAIRGSFGNTGARASSILTFFHTPPPKPAPSASTVTFTRYGVKKAIPTSLSLPCAGTGKVYFMPLATSSSARTATVRVGYIGQP
jgi:hypothetical protein